MQCVECLNAGKLLEFCLDDIIPVLHDTFHPIVGNGKLKCLEIKKGFQCFFSFVFNFNNYYVVGWIIFEQIHLTYRCIQKGNHKFEKVHVINLEILRTVAYRDSKRVAKNVALHIAIWKVVGHATVNVHMVAYNNGREYNRNAATRPDRREHVYVR